MHYFIILHLFFALFVEGLNRWQLWWTNELITARNEVYQLCWRAHAAATTAVLPTAGIISLLGRVLFGTPLLCTGERGDGVLICTAV